jgi:hypothetical protein
VSVRFDRAYRAQAYRRSRADLEGPFPPRAGKVAARQANAARSRVRSAVEHIFADQKHRTDLFVRTIGLARARTKIGMANLAYNLRLYLEAHAGET